MALSLSQTFALTTILKPGMKVVSLGYPDMIAPEELIAKFSQGYEYREDSETICKRHGLSQRNIPDAISVFQKAGCELIVYDIIQERGCEVLCDLNRPLNFYRHKLGTFDIVLDVGTIEHCFNIAQALMNVAELAKEGGYIIHENPFNWPNHGFYNLNPTLFHDFYTTNGFELIKCFLTTRGGEMGEVSLTRRFRLGSDVELNIFTLVKRTKIQSLVMPTQSKYLKLIPDAGVRA